MRRIAAHLIFLDGRLFRHPLITLNDEGIITDIAIDRTEIDSLHSTEFYDGILMPDMVNCHSHTELSHLRGAIAEGGGFTSFARSMGSIRGGYSSEERVAAWSAADRALWEQGVGAVGDICNGVSTFVPKQESPINYLNFIELFGLGSKTADPARSVCEAGKQAGLRCNVTPHSTYSLTKAAFAESVAAADPSLPLSIHFMESADEKLLFAGRGEMAQWYAESGRQIDFEHFGTPAERLIAQVPCDRKILLIHNCYVTEQEVERLEEHFSGGITWVLCPRSNHYISRTAPPVGMLRRKGVRIAIGTDSLASNRELNMAAEMAALDAPLEEILDWATRSGAEALGMEERMRGLAVGNRSGIVILSGLSPQFTLSDRSTTRRIV